MSTAERPAPSETASPVAADLVEAIWVLLGATRRYKARRPHGDGELGIGELRILGQLGSLGGPASMGEVSRGVCLNPASTTAAVDRLEAQGLVRRERDTVDRRVVHVDLTDAGRGAVDRRVSAWQAEWAEVLAALPAEDLAVTARTLRAVALAVDGH